MYKQIPNVQNKTWHKINCLSQKRRKFYQSIDMRGKISKTAGADVLLWFMIWGSCRINQAEHIFVKVND